MCAPSDELLFAEDLIRFIAKRRKWEWESSIQVAKFRSELQTKFSLEIGMAVEYYLGKKESEIKLSLQNMTSQELSWHPCLKACILECLDAATAEDLLKMLAWAVGFGLLCFQNGDETAMDTALFLIADSLRMVPKSNFLAGDFWEAMNAVADDYLPDFSQSSVIIQELPLKCNVTFKSGLIAGPSIKKRKTMDG